MIRKAIKCGCIIQIDTHYTITYCVLHNGDVNQQLFKLAQMVVMWDGDAPTYIEILRCSFPLVKQILENPETRLL